MSFCIPGAQTSNCERKNVTFPYIIFIIPELTIRWSIFKAFWPTGRTTLYCRYILCIYWLYVGFLLKLTKRKFVCCGRYIFRSHLYSNIMQFKKIYKQHDYQLFLFALQTFDLLTCLMRENQFKIEWMIWNMDIKFWRHFPFTFL